MHRYLKTFNTKKGIGHDDWVLEDVKTSNLDLIAQKKGYTGYAVRHIESMINSGELELVIVYQGSTWRRSLVDNNFE